MMKPETYNIIIVPFWLYWFSLGREYFKTEPKDWVSAIAWPAIAIGCFIAACKLEQFFDPVDEARQKERLDGYLLGMPLLLLMVTGNLITEVTYFHPYPALYTAVTLAMICVTWVWVGRDTIQRVRSYRQQSTSENTGKSEDI